MGVDGKRLCDIAFGVLAKYPGLENHQKRTEILGRFFRLADKNISVLTLDLLTRFPGSAQRSIRTELLRECLSASKDKQGRVYSAHDYVLSAEPLSGSDRWLVEGHVLFAGCVYNWESEDGPGCVRPEYQGYLVDVFINSPNGQSECILLKDDGHFERFWTGDIYRQYGREQETLVPKTS